MELHFAAGVELSKESSDAEREVNVAVRIGAGYEFEVGGFSIAPEFNLDLVANESPAIVYGLAFGKSF